MKPCVKFTQLTFAKQMELAKYVISPEGARSIAFHFPEIPRGISYGTIPGKKFFPVIVDYEDKAVVVAYGRARLAAGVRVNFPDRRATASVMASLIATMLRVASAQEDPHGVNLIPPRFVVVSVADGKEPMKRHSAQHSLLLEVCGPVKVDQGSALKDWEKKLPNPWLTTSAEFLSPLVDYPEVPDFKVPSDTEVTFVRDFLNEWRSAHKEV